MLLVYVFILQCVLVILPRIHSTYKISSPVPCHDMLTVRKSPFFLFNMFFDCKNGPFWVTDCTTHICKNSLYNCSQSQEVTKHQKSQNVSPLLCDSWLWMFKTSHLGSHRTMWKYVVLPLYRCLVMLVLFSYISNICLFYRSGKTDEMRGKRAVAAGISSLRSCNQNDYDV